MGGVNHMGVTPSGRGSATSVFGTAAPNEGADLFARLDGCAGVGH
jgi:hypothetical protein